jgi:hypothetical protein
VLLLSTLPWATRDYYMCGRAARSNCKTPCTRWRYATAIASPSRCRSHPSCYRRCTPTHSAPQPRPPCCMHRPCTGPSHGRREAPLQTGRRPQPRAPAYAQLTHAAAFQLLPLSRAFRSCRMPPRSSSSSSSSASLSQPWLLLAPPPPSAAAHWSTWPSSPWSRQRRRRGPCAWRPRLPCPRPPPRPPAPRTPAAAVMGGGDGWG